MSEWTSDEPRARAHEQVLGFVEEGIATGRLRVGDRLPPEREFAAQLGVSRASVREAVRVLEAMGIVRSSVGQGPDGGTVLTPGSSSALTRLLKLHIGLSNFPMPDAIEARVMLERWSCRLAAQFATPDEIARMHATLDAMARPGVPRDEFNDLDTHFHVQIAQAGHNRLVADMTTAIRDAMRWWIMQSFEEREDWDELAEELHEAHTGILEAIASHRPIRAADRVEAHIRSSYASLLWSRERD
ncbi:FadR/GntR family transcriptional regulator [Propioniciclava tarda]|uniref:FadR family transcriptional regulator n=1 Tax=Propioniciclava tarda TaxID=433330 RepID=A0A4Q9KJD2_PROTD|nr:FCD domain-containing protein [Propioniciclava tarda]TBT94536.1 FadR family transcriptional regulator [Propioniciclava tarda]SMO68658.1 transcriptional regulator, GntR family [Propioniciclava tarda]HOA87847.1 FCD domain-containing protein [Propioniciclava tarda]HQA29989.1 FCD domain-containing protein [Propioniciclava tarda]HQD59625.1 FCD domain-containing protein [Propioniciclava tarda]